MLVGIIQLHLIIPARTLKEKRRIINSIKDKTRNKFNVSIAEIDHNDSHSRALIGIAVISNDGNHINSTLHSILNYLDMEFPGLVNNYDIEII
ncbi:MAG: DUF503 domain-containing protein [Brevinematales bacterium]|nr:DUF503 domain-containing protein [Brevinematales bacterium]